MLHLYKIIEKTNLNKKYSIHIIKNIDLLELDIKKPDCQRSFSSWFRDSLLVVRGGGWSLVVGSVRTYVRMYV